MALQIQHENGSTYQDSLSINGHIYHSDSGIIHLSNWNGDQIKIEAAGYLSQSISISERGTYSIRLRKDPILKAQSADFDNRRISSVGALSSIMDLLQVQPISGYVAPDDGQLGASWQMLSRGFQTILGNSQPLILLDGVPIISNNFLEPTESFDLFRFIDLQRIDSMRWITSAAENSQWGSLGGNGVLHLFSKHPTSGSRIRYQAELRGMTPLLPQNQRLQGLSAEQYLDLFVTGFENAPGGMNRYRDQLLTQFPGAVDFNDQDEPIPAGINTPWIEQIERKGWGHHHQLSYRGGFDQLQYSVHGTYHKSLGIIQSNDQQDIQLGGKLHGQLKKLKYAMHTQYAHITQHGLRTGDRWDNPMYVGLQLPSLIPVFDDNGTFYKDHLPYFFRGANPVGLVAGEDITKHVNKVFWHNSNLTYAIFENLQLNGIISYMDNRFESIYYRNQLFGLGQLTNGVGMVSDFLTTQFYTNLHLIWSSKEMNGLGHRLRLGADYLDNRWEQSLMEAENFRQNHFTNIETAETVRYWSSENPPSQFAGVNVDYDLKTSIGLGLQLHGRLDGSSQYGINNSKQIYYGGLISWDLRNMLRNQVWLDFLELSLGYGKTGNGRIPSGQNRTTLLESNYNNVPGVRINQLANPDLGPEIIKSGEARIQGSLFKYRIQFDFEFFNQQAEEIIYRQEIAQVTGNINRLINEASIHTQGIQGSLSITPIRNASLQWSCQGGLTYIRKNNFDHIKRPYIEQDKIYIQEGFVAGYLLYDWQGVGEDNGMPRWRSEQDPDLATSNLNQARREYLEVSGNPLQYGFIRNFINYRNISVQAWMNFAFNHGIFDESGWILFSDGQFPVRSQPQQASDKWSSENPQAAEPIFIWNNSSQSNSKFSSRYLRDGSYFRLNRIEARYHLTPKQCKRLRCLDGQLYVGIKNAWTWMRDSSLYVNPMAPINGTVNVPIPNFKTWYAGFNIAF